MTVGDVQIIRPPDTTLSVNIDPTLLGTGYIDLPLGEMFIDYSAGVGVTLERMPAGALSTAEARLYQLGAANNSYRTLVWIAAAYSNLTNRVNRWHTNFRLPGDYVANTDLTFYLSSTYVVADDTTPAITATLAITARRNIPSAGKEGFGYRVDPAVDTWTANTNLVTAGSPISVLMHDSGTSEFDQNSLTIDGDDGSFPLSAGNLMQIEFTATLDADTSAAAMYLANFYLTYTRKIN